MGSNPWVLVRLAVVFALLAVCVSGDTLAQSTSADNGQHRKESAVSSGERSGDAANDPSPVVPVQPPAGYRVGVDDELVISVWHEPEFSQSVVVRPDGMITLPLLNDIKVVGLSTEELRGLMTEKLKSLVNDPQVTIIVKSIKSMKVFLAGSVAKQGMYPLTSGMTALQLITEAGGLGPFAKGGSIYILRTVNGKEARIPFNYKKALKGQGDDPVLQTGDMVVVP